VRVLSSHSSYFQAASPPQRGIRAELEDSVNCRPSIRVPGDVVAEKGPRVAIAQVRPTCRRTPSSVPTRRDVCDRDGGHNTLLQPWSTTPEEACHRPFGQVMVHREWGEWDPYLLNQRERRLRETSDHPTVTPQASSSVLSRADALRDDRESFRDPSSQTQVGPRQGSSPCTTSRRSAPASGW